MHEDFIAALGGEFTAIALDTPGYGRSSPLPDQPRPEISDYATALAQALTALGIERAPVYGFHTSSKIALQFAIDHPGRASRIVIDGLNLPPGGPSEEFIARYMKPYEVQDDGSHLAATWARARDLHRFFPWFDTRPQSRLPLEFPDDRALHAYSLDMLSAGRHYSAAYSAAMRYLALPQIPRLTVPTVFSCRENDPLFAFLDLLPQPLPAGCSIARMPADRAVWRERIAAELRIGAQGLPTIAATTHDPLRSASGAERCGYLSVAGGQVLVRRVGAGPHPPMLMLPEAPGSSVSLLPLARAVAAAGERAVWVMDLPGSGGSDPLPVPDLASFAGAVLDALRSAGLARVDVYAEFTAVPIALQLAQSHPEAVRALLLAGVFQLNATERRALWKNYCPPLAPRQDGSHYLALWHRLRDQELCWPWYERSIAGIRRREADLGGERLTALTLDLARQIDTYGDAARAAFDADTRALFAGVTQPTLVVQDPDDARDAWAVQITKRNRAMQRTNRPASAELHAGRLLQFLAGLQG